MPGATVLLLDHVAWAVLTVVFSSASSNAWGEQSHMHNAGTDRGISMFNQKRKN